MMIMMINDYVRSMFNRFKNEFNSHILFPMYLLFADNLKY